ncbi:MAG: PAS domain S-box protein [Actinobacteria bacterium]|nr:PAS domain S-box protein [Actinomycetota bacterium]
MTKQVRVLVVDDQPGEAKLIALILERELEAETTLTYGYAEALEEVFSGKYDIVTLDYQLNSHNGLDLLSEIQKMDSPPPVVMVTGHGDEQVAVSAFKLGVSGYVVKDNRMKTLLVEEARSALARHELARVEKELEEKAEERALLLDNIPTLVWYLTDHETYGAVNWAMADFFGVRQEDYENAGIADVGGMEAPGECRVLNEELFAKKEQIFCERCLEDKQGRPHTFRVVKTPKLDSDGNVQYVVCTGEDITERKRAEKILSVQRDLALQLSEDLEFEEILAKCIGILMDATGFDVGGAYLREEETGGFRHVYHKGTRSREAVEAIGYIGPENPRYRLLADGDHIFMNFKDFPAPADDARLKEGLKVSSIFPIRDKDRVIGSVNVASHTIEELSRETKDLIESLSGQVGQILSRAILDRALRFSETRHRVLFDSNQDGILYLDERGNVIDVNQAFQYLSGYTVDEIKSGIFPRSICRNNGPEMLEEFTRTVFNEGRVEEIECELIGKNGVLLDTDVKGFAVYGQRGEPVGIWMIFRDVTKQKKTEKYFKAQRDIAVDVLRAENLEEALNTGMQAILDITGMDCGVAGFLDRERRKFTLAYSHGLSDEFIEAAVKAVSGNSKYREIQASGPVYSRYDLLPISKDSVRSAEGIKAIAILPIIENGEMIGGVNVGSHTMEEIPGESRDIIESLVYQMGWAIGRYRLLSAYRESEEIFQALVKASPDPILVHDLKNRTIMVSRAALDTLGYGSEEELLGRDIVELVAEEYVEETREAMLEVMKCGSSAGNEIEVVRKDGGRLTFDVSGSLVHDSEGNPRAIVITARDITERKNTEMKLKSMNAELKGYAHTVSHDLKGPVSNIILGADLCGEIVDKLARDDHSNELREIVDLMNNHAKRALDLIQDLLSIAEAGKMPMNLEDVDVGRILERIRSKLSQEIKRKNIRLRVDENPGVIHANPTQIYQLFSNLVRNAVQHGVDRSVENPIIEIKRLPLPAPGKHRYLISDNGPGIPDEIASGLFGAFAGTGDLKVGLGLSIVEKIVSTYDGEIKAYNDNGACFEFTISDA